MGLKDPPIIILSQKTCNPGRVAAYGSSVICMRFAKGEPVTNCHALKMILKRKDGDRMKNCNCLLDWYAIDRTSGIGYMIETCNRLNRDQNSHLVRYMKALNKFYDYRGAGMKRG